MTSFPELPLPQVDTLLNVINEDQAVCRGGYDADLITGAISFTPRLQRFFKSHNIAIPTTIAEFRNLFLPGQIPPFFQVPEQQDRVEIDATSRNFTGAMRINTAFFQASHSYVLDEESEGGCFAQRRLIRVFLSVREISWLNPEKFSLSLLKAQKEAREALQRLFAMMEVGERNGMIVEDGPDSRGQLGDNFVVDALLDSFLTTANPEPDLDMFLPHPLLAGVIGRVHDRAGLMGIRLKLLVQKSPNVCIKGDRLSIARVLNALLQDALAASRSGDKVLLVARFSETKLTIRVLRKRGSQNHGPRALMALRLADAGTGLITLKTTSGAHIAELQLPIILPDGASSVPSGVRLAPRALAAPAPRLKVLIAEDEPEILSVLSQLLRRTYDVIEVGENWIRFLEEFPKSEPPPDVLVVDFHLAPNLTGLDVLDHARALWGARMPAICLTAIDERLDPEANKHLTTMRERGISVYRKPIRIAALIEAIKAAHDATNAGLV